MVGHLKTGAADPVSLALTPAEVKGLMAAIGVGGMFALFRAAAKADEKDVSESRAMREAAYTEMRQEERSRERELGRARRRSESYLTTQMARRGLDPVAADPNDPAWVMEAARRQPPPGSMSMRRMGIG